MHSLPQVYLGEAVVGVCSARITIRAPSPDHNPARTTAARIRPWHFGVFALQSLKVAKFARVSGFCDIDVGYPQYLDV
jgi:hypothetical protein